MVRRTGAVELKDGPTESSLQVLVNTAQDAHLGERVVGEGEVLYMRASTHRLRRVHLVLLLLLLLLILLLLHFHLVMNHHHRSPVCRGGGEGRGEGGRGHPPKRHAKVRRGRPKRVHLERGQPVGRDVGAQLVQDLRDRHGAGLVRQDDGARAGGAEDGGTDLRVERARVRGGGEARAEAALEEEGEEVEGQAVRGRVDGLDGAVEELGEGGQRLLG